MNKIFLLITALLLTACTTGHITYYTPEGEKKTACETEYRWAPTVDKHAVNYVLSYCARKAVAKGYTVEHEELLTLDLTIPAAPAGKEWTFERATTEYDAGRLTAKEYGYVVAWLDLGKP